MARRSLTPLQALNDLKNCLQAYYTMESVPKVDSNLLTIEKALKENIELKQMIRNFNEAIGEPQIITPAIEKKLKALEIITNKIVENHWNEILSLWLKEKLINQKEYDLLKEVLK